MYDFNIKEVKKMEFDVDALQTAKEKLEDVLYHDEELSEKDLQMILNTIEDILAEIDE